MTDISKQSVRKKILKIVFVVIYILHSLECAAIPINRSNNNDNDPNESKVDLAGLNSTCTDAEITTKLVLGFKNVLTFYTFGRLSVCDKVETVFLNNQSQIGAVEYNPINETIFLSDTTTYKIYEFNPRTKELHTIIDDVISVVGISYDVVGKNLYWVDNITKQIEVLSLTNGAVKIISGEMMDTPSDIIVIPEERIFFVTLNSQNQARIVRYNMDGTGRFTMRTSSNAYFESLAYNRELKRIYWTETYDETIQSMSLNGYNWKITDRKSSGYYSLANFNYTLYWVDRKLHCITSKDLLNPELPRKSIFGTHEERNVSKESFEKGNFYAKISILQNLLTFKKLLENHECSFKNLTSKCSHICLLSTKVNKATCSCPENLELDSDWKTCSMHCPGRQFRCNGNTCIPEDRICDGYKDCLSGEDEDNCPELPMIVPCEESETNCSPHSAPVICDNSEDCNRSGLFNDQQETKNETSPVVAPSNFHFNTICDEGSDHECNGNAEPEKQSAECDMDKPDCHSNSTTSALPPISIDSEQFELSDMDVTTTTITDASTDNNRKVRQVSHQIDSIIPYCHMTNPFGGLSVDPLNETNPEKLIDNNNNNNGPMTVISTDTVKIQVEGALQNINNKQFKSNPMLNLFFFLNNPSKNVNNV